MKKHIHTGSLLDSDGRAIRLSCDSWTPLDCTLGRDQSAVYDYFSDRSVNLGNLQNVLVLGGYSSGKSTLLANIAQVLKRRYPRSGILILASSPTHCCIFKSLFRRKFVSLDAMTYAQVESFSGNVGKFDFVLCDDAHLMTPGVMGKIRAMDCYVIAFGNPHCFLDFPRECGGKAAEGRVSLEKIASVFGMIKMRLNSLHGISGDVASLSSRLMSGVGAGMDAGAYVDVNIPMEGAEGIESIEGMEGMGHRPLGVESHVRICSSDTLSNEVGMAMRIASSALSGGKLCAILLPNHAMISEFANCLISMNSIMEDMSVVWNGRYNLLNSSFKRFDIPVRCVSRKTPCLRSDSAALMTIEDAMGLHFDTVILSWTSRYPVSEWREKRCHQMLSAALTRCSGDVLMSYSGQIPKWLDAIRPCSTLEESAMLDVDSMPEGDSALEVNANLHVNTEAQDADPAMEVNATLDMDLAKPGNVA